MSNNLNAKIAEVACPRCGARSEFTGWPTIPNVFLPEVAEALLEGTLFEYECDECGYADLAPYECLYHDVPNAKIAILAPDPARREQARAELARMICRSSGSSFEDVPKHEGRLVFHPDRLSEKARIFAAGLDDCAIELMKLKIKEQLIGDDVLFETASLYFEEAEDGLVFFHVSGFEDGSVTALRELYDQARIDLMLAPPRVEDFVVDEQWAQAYMRDSLLEEAGSV